MSLTPRFLRSTFCVILGSAALWVGSPAAQASWLVDQAVSCDSYFFENAFLRWEAPLTIDYVLAPDGGFESRARGWQLSGGARAVHGNESYYVHRRTDSRSLLLPAGATATSPAMCAGIEYPTLRMFTRTKGAASMLGVEMLYENPVTHLQEEISLLPADLTTGKRWGPTLPIVLPVPFFLLPTLSDDTAAIAFRFTAPADVDWWIDDVYVDPYRRY